MLQKAIPTISKQMLVNQLRGLEEGGFIERKIYAEIPPRVEYSVTEHGKSLLPLIEVVQTWGIEDVKRGTSRAF